MKKRLLSVWLAVITVFNCPVPVLADDAAAADEAVEIPVQNYDITVETDERQTYEGFGFSMASSSGSHDSRSDWEKEKIAQYGYDDLKVEALRLWLPNKSTFVSADKINLMPFINQYKSGFLDIAKKRGIKLLLAPQDHFPDFLKGEDVNPDTGKKQGWGGGVRPSMADTYAKLLAMVVRDLKFEYDVPIYATGIANEPSNMSAQSMALIIPALRKYLDEFDCSEVFIVAPELANNDWRAIEFFDYFKARPEAWSNIDMLSTHSYNMSVTEQIGKYTDELESKRFWQTESSITHYDDSAGYGVAVTTAARFINDLNHWCTLWMHFQGISSGTTERTSVSGWNGAKREPEHKKMYWYIKQIVDTYDKGAIFYHSISDQLGEMEYTYGIKCPLYCATAQNPDGTWAICVLNATDTVMREAEQPMSKFRKENVLRADTVMNVKLNVLGLAESGTQKFKVMRSGKEGLYEEVSEITAEDGVINLTLQPGDLYSLRSVNSIEKTEVETEYEEYTEEVLILPDQPEDMSDFQYQLWIQGSQVINYDMSKLPEWTPTYETVVKKRLKTTGGGSVDKHLISLFIGSPEAFITGKKMRFAENDEGTVPIIQNGTAYVPVRFVEMLGGKASYSSRTGKLSISLNGYNIDTQTGKNGMYINGAYRTAKGSIMQSGNRLFIPLRDIAEGAGYSLNWDDRGLVTLTDNVEMDKIRYSLAEKFSKKLVEAEAETEAEIEEESTEAEEAPMDETEGEKVEETAEKDERLVSTSAVDKNIVSLMVGNPWCFVKGKEFNFDQNNGAYPQIIDGTTYVPVRFVEMLGGTAKFNSGSGKAEIRIGNHNIEAVLDKPQMTVNGETKSIQGTTRMIGGKLYLPLRALADNSGMKLYWDNSGLIVLTDNIETDGIIQKIIEKFFPKEDETTEETEETAEVIEEEAWGMYSDIL